MTAYKLLYINNPGTESDITQDFTANNNDITVNGPVQVEGKLGDCYEFSHSDTSTDYLDCGNGSTLDVTNFSLELWIYNQAGSQSWPTIFFKGASPAGYIWVYTTGTNESDINIQGHTGISTITVSWSGVLSKDVWNHVVIVYDNTTKAIDLYVDGVAQTQKILTAGLPIANGTFLSLGTYNRSTSASYRFYGKMDEVLFYARKLTAGEVTHHYNDGIGRIFDPTTETNLKGYWRFDPIGFNDISMFLGDFRLERELEKMLDKLTLKISRRIDNAANFVGFDPDIELLLKFNNMGIFRGRCKTSNKKEYYEVEAYSSAEILNRTIVKKIYENISPEAIFTDLINTYSDLTPSTSESSITIKRLVADDYVGTIIQKLAEALGWSIYTNSSKTIFFRPRGTVTNSTVIRRQTSSSNAKFGEWRKDYNEMCNSIKLTGDNLNYNTQESFTGDGNKKEFYITEQPIDIRITINNIEQNIDTYYIEAENRKIIFQSIPSSGSTIVVTYSYAYPIYVERNDATSISTYGTFTKIFTHKWIKTRVDAITFCENYIDTYKDILLSNNLIMNAAHITTFTPGEQVRIIDDLEEYDDNYIINKIKLELTKSYIELNIGSYIPIFVNLQTSIQDRIKELEKNLSKATIQLYNNNDETLIPSEPLIDLVNSYSESNWSIDGKLYGGFVTERGQCFTNTTSVDISRAKFYIKKTGTPTGNMSAVLYNATGTVGVNAVPTGAAIAESYTIDASTLTTTSSLVEFNFDTPVTLTSGAAYAVTIKFSGGDISNNINIGADNTSPTHGGNGASYTSSWLGVTGVDYIFYIYTNNINHKIQATYPPKCDYGRGTLYDSRIGLCQS